MYGIPRFMVVAIRPLRLDPRQFRTGRASAEPSLHQHIDHLDIQCHDNDTYCEHGTWNSDSVSGLSSSRIGLHDSVPCQEPEFRLHQRLCERPEARVRLGQVEPKTTRYSIVLIWMRARTPRSASQHPILITTAQRQARYCLIRW